MSERKMAERHQWTDEKGERFQVTAAGRVERWWPHEQAWADASKHNACSELLRVVAERDKALEALADLRGVSIDSILGEMRNE